MWTLKNPEAAKELKFFDRSKDDIDLNSIPDFLKPHVKCLQEGMELTEVKEDKEGNAICAYIGKYKFGNRTS
jgi:hypothetical protein